MACRTRTEPTLVAEFEAMEHGTDLEASALYHCEIFTYCDPIIIEWYYVSANVWAAALDYVWKDITP
jgi:hypothetical protein